MKRRTVIVVAATSALTAGCLGSDDTVFEDDVSAGDSAAYDFFDADAGDELEITIESSDDGANVGVSSTELDGIDEGTNWWGWELEPNEELTDTIEIVEDDEYTVWINEGEASVTIERT